MGGDKQPGPGGAENDMPTVMAMAWMQTNQSINQSIPLCKLS